MLPDDVLKNEVKAFLHSPFPLWENGLTDKLVALNYELLKALNISGRLDYGTSTALQKAKLETEKQFLAAFAGNTIYLETPDQENLSAFYGEHGLVPLTKRQLSKERAATKLKAALNLLGAIPECIACVSSLVNCIQVIASEGLDYDTSYSHPAIPFTILVSVCEDDSPLSNIRVAEGVLHEAMHLKLSLIQQQAELIQPGTNETFYSPWRDEERPLNGVLHGVFVFRAIYDYYSYLSNQQCSGKDVLKMINYRLADIKKEFALLQHFEKSAGLTATGKSLATNLLRYQHPVSNR